MKNNHEVKMMTPFTFLLILVIGIGVILAIYRLTSGLGATTNLNDDFPWGLWIGFDMLGGVAMAAGGFIIAGAVYLLNMKKYKPIVRSAVLTAFLGYLLAIIALMLDLGHPFRIWHPGFMWQVHSVMWVVAMHVIFYTMTLAIESSPMLFEKLKWQKAVDFVNKIIVPVVLFGVMLSVLHQSSLGALYLIAQGKLSPLWSIGGFLPYMFLASAVMMGLSMVSIESIASAKSFNHTLDLGIISGLARGTIITLVIYLTLKLYFLATGLGIGAVFTGTPEANMYLLEVIGGIILPLVILASANKKGDSMSGLVLGHILVIVGVLINRFNVSISGLYGFQSATGSSYFPSVIEFLITLALVALGIFLFKLTAKYLSLFPKAEAEY
jgi:Ni/Fe-hydrogenase subunit HybB-like protein